MTAITRIVETPLIQKYGDEIIQVYLETGASQVKIKATDNSDSDVQREIEKLRSKVNTVGGVVSGSKREIEVKTSIQGRDDIEDPEVGTLCWVTDATGDSSVTSGGAAYIYNGTSWDKIAEAESIDMVLSWDTLQGKPQSSVDNIDDAVTKRHSHLNRDTLDKLSVNEFNQLQFNSAPINQGGYYTTVSPDDPEFLETVNAMNIPDGAFLTIYVNS